MAQKQVVEIQARTVDDAVRLALEQLGLPREQVHVEVLVDNVAEGGEALVRVTPLHVLANSGNATRTAPPRVDPQTEALVKQVVRELLSAMGFTCDVMAVDNPSIIELGPNDPPTVFIDIFGPRAGMLIGRRGEHLAQLQYLVNVLVNRRLPQWTRVILDIEGYRSRREESLINLAQRVARQVARTRRPVTLEPMPANERRVIHVALRNHPDVTTRSSGEGDQRRVTIYPRGMAPADG
ncbi:RNA-binding cell elongation regulator Jag/EloR [Thermorudis peleae]|uniref:RNA-binding cell elongation regulator Jag/EloR n=1 Tax=Thermorudis peleae TaxID=1382356 RepID=UPI00057079E0|nr:RNA-binding cell elongation regulator Jag/EloR [Thermorudis peleae]MBX6753389.1 protein jag [Thermorudis peleae]